MAVEQTADEFYGSITNGIELISTMTSIIWIIFIIAAIIYFIPNISTFFERKLTNKRGHMKEEVSDIEFIPKKEVSGKAMLSLFIVLLGSLITAIPAIILGHLALRDINRNPNLRGAWLAWLGLILGYFFLLIDIVICYLVYKWI